MTKLRNRIMGKSKSTMCLSLVQIHVAKQLYAGSFMKCRTGNGAQGLCRHTIRSNSSGVLV